MEKRVAVAGLTLALALGCSLALAADDAKKAKPQTKCPVMGGKIDAKLFVDSGGKRIYACCARCLTSLKKTPQKYIAKLEAQGVTLARTPVTLCTKCGEIKGTAVCCKAEGRTKCPKCGLFEGAPGCCKIPKGTTKPVVLCLKCGEIKGTAVCCKAEGRTKCAKCGLFKGAPGCCKIPK